MKLTHIIIHYSEIAIKKDNRSTFENILVKNLKEALDIYISKIYKRFGRIICVLSEDYNLEHTISVLEKTAGVHSFSFCVTSVQDLEEIKKKTKELATDISFDNFRVSTKRSFKGFKYTSQETDRLVGEEIYENLKKKVKLKNPELEINIEITEKEVFIYTNKETYKGIGGLPVGSTGTVICSLSGGIDSPVSGYMLNKRGCKVVYAHIQSNNLVTKEVEEKIFKLCSTLKNYQGRTKLIVIPFSEIQKQLLMVVPADYRMIIYRRFMFRIINKLAEREGALGIVTGDSVGQVASQTLENLNCIYEASKLPIFSPLIGLNKDEIIDIAQKINTYEISIMPYPDCCSFMVATHPKTRGKIEEVKDIENNIKDIDALVDEAISRSKNYYF